MSPILKLHWQDLVKGLVVAFLTGIVTAIKSLIQNMIATHAFAFTMVDLYTVLAVAGLSALGYLGKQLITDEDGKLGGII